MGFLLAAEDSQQPGDTMYEQAKKILTEIFNILLSGSILAVTQSNGKPNVQREDLLMAAKGKKDIKRETKKPKKTKKK